MKIFHNSYINSAFEKCYKSGRIGEDRKRGKYNTHEKDEKLDERYTEILFVKPQGKKLLRRKTLT